VGGDELGQRQPHRPDAAAGTLMNYDRAESEGARDAARALMAGRVEAACMIDANHLRFTREGTLTGGRTPILAQTPLGMSYADPGRVPTAGATTEAAVDALDFYDHAASAELAVPGGPVIMPTPSALLDLGSELRSA
jgi:hypothetical protein